MERFYIVKEAPDEGKWNNKCYTYDEAVARAKSLASGNRLTYVVMRAVRAFGPVADVQEIDIGDGV